MTASDTTSLALAATANAAGVVVALGMWRRARRRRGAVRARHPSVQPPLAVDLVPGGEGTSLRVDVRRGAPPLALDIVSFRLPVPDAAWDSVPIVDPVLVEPGASVMLPTTLPRSTDAADVVIAWTAHHPTGELEDSRLLWVPATRSSPAAPLRSGVLGGRLTLALVALLAGSMFLVARSAAVGDGPEQLTPAPPTTQPATPTIDTTTATANDTTSQTARITPAPSTDPPVTPTDPLATTVAAPTTASPMVSSTGTTNTSAPTTGPQVLVEALQGPCRFADDCLIVSFTIEGFATRPQEYVCEFDDGSRFTFRFDSGGVDEACATGSPDATITVEIDGIRSETVTIADVPTG